MVTEEVSGGSDNRVLIHVGRLRARGGVQTLHEQACGLCKRFSEASDIEPGIETNNDSLGALPLTTRCEHADICSGCRAEPGLIGVCLLCTGDFLHT